MNEMRKLISLLEAIESSQISDEWFQGAKTFAKKGTPESFQIADQDGEVKTLENPKPVPYRKGDYIITGPKGEQYVIAPEKFRELKVDNGDGTASPKPIPKLAKLADHDGHVVVDWGSGPQKLHYKQGQDVVVRHGANDYGVVKKDIFQQTYEPVAGSVNESMHKPTMTPEEIMAKLQKDMQGTHTGVHDADSDWGKYVLDHSVYTLKELPIDSLPQTITGAGINKDNVERYKQKDLSNAPPIVISKDNTILDGNHRAIAAKAQGAKTIKAYVGEGKGANIMNEMRKLMETMDSVVEYPILENAEYNSKYVNMNINWEGLADAVRADILSFKKENDLYNVDEALKVADAIEGGNWRNVEDTISGLSSISDRHQMGRFIEKHAGGYFWWGFRADINFK